MKTFMAGVTPAAKVNSSCKLLVMLLLCFLIFPSLFFAVVFFSFFSTLLFVHMLCVLTATLIFSEIIDRAPVWILRSKWRNIFYASAADNPQEYHSEKGEFDAVDHDHPCLQEQDAQACADLDPLEIPSTNTVSEEEEEEEYLDPLEIPSTKNVSSSEEEESDDDDENINRSTGVPLRKEEQFDRKGEDVGEIAGMIRKSEEQIQEDTKFIEALSFWRSRESRNRRA